MSVHLCRNCRHFKDGKCCSEKLRLRWRHDGSEYFIDPPTRSGNDGCSWAFNGKDKQRGLAK